MDLYLISNMTDRLGRNTTLSTAWQAYCTVRLVNDMDDYKKNHSIFVGRTFCYFDSSTLNVFCINFNAFSRSHCNFQQLIICVAVSLLRFRTGMATIYAMEEMSEDGTKELGHCKINTCIYTYEFRISSCPVITAGFSQYMLIYFRLNLEVTICSILQFVSHTNQYKSSLRFPGNHVTD